MTLIVALPELALRLSRLFSGARYVVQVGGPDGSELQRQVRRHRPDVVILDWRVGGSSWRAIDQVEEIVKRSPTHPHVIVILPWISRVVEKAAAECGCFDAITVSASDFDRDVLHAVDAARADRLQTRPHEHRRVSRQLLH